MLGLDQSSLTSAVTAVLEMDELMSDNAHDVLFSTSQHRFAFVDSNEDNAVLIVFSEV